MVEKKYRNKEKEKNDIYEKNNRSVNLRII